MVTVLEGEVLSEDSLAMKTSTDSLTLKYLNTLYLDTWIICHLALKQKLFKKNVISI